MGTIQKDFIDVVENKKSGIGARLVQTALLTGTCMYGPLSSLIRMIELKRKKKLPCVVISVGNITWGGTGKTSLIELLVREIIKKEKKVSILMRGYGNDENILLQTQFPTVDVICGKNRYKNGMRYLTYNQTDVFLLDDGFQQWGLYRDLDIITINCLNPWGNGYLIPRGNLREPIQSLQRADIVILTNTNCVSGEKKDSIKQDITHFISIENIFESIHQPQYFYRAGTPHEALSLDTLKGRKALIFSGIGSPDSFKKTLEDLHIVIAENVIFEDHHSYTVDDCATIKKMRDADASLSVITTEKDLMRNHSLITEEINPYILKVHMEIQDNYDGFIHRLDRILGS